MTYVKSTIVGYHPHEGWIILWKGIDSGPLPFECLPTRWAALGNFANYKINAGNSPDAENSGLSSPKPFRERVNLTKDKERIQAYINAKLTIFKVLGQLA